MGSKSRWNQKNTKWSKSRCNQESTKWSKSRWNWESTKWSKSRWNKKSTKWSKSRWNQKNTKWSKSRWNQEIHHIAEPIRTLLVLTVNQATTSNLFKMETLLKMEKDLKDQGLCYLLRLDMVLLVGKFLEATTEY